MRARSRAACAASFPSSTAERADKLPPKFPTAVRAAEAITTFFINLSFYEKILFYGFSPK
jgi:hypothetical protein